MTLPKNILLRHSRSGGVRLAKMVQLPDEAGKCPVCKRAVVKRMITGYMQPDGVYYNGDYYHYVCRAAVREKPDNNRYNRSTSEILPKGNLPMEEYRYWIGVNAHQIETKWAMCRACRTCTYGQDQRNAHFIAREHEIEGDACTVRLVKAYKQLLGQDTCIVCKKNRHKYDKWGVPLCNSLTCQMAWMFDQTNWLMLAQLLNLQIKKAEFLAGERAKKTEFSQYAPYEKYLSFCTVTKIDTKNEEKRPWCGLCHIFMDDAAHPEVHAAYELSEGSQSN